MFYSNEFYQFLDTRAVNNTTAETFLPIQGFEDYEVSNLGRILSHKRGSSKILKSTVSTLGYLEVKLYRDGKQYHRYIHRLVMQVFDGVAPDGFQVRHLDGDAQNCKLSNLAYGTPFQNSQDKKRHGTDRSRGLLSEDEVRDILMSAMRGERTRETSARLKIPAYVVSDVRTGYTYKAVSPELPRRLSKPAPK